MEVKERVLPVFDEVTKVANQRQPCSILSTSLEIWPGSRQESSVGVLDDRSDEESDRGQDSVLNRCSFALSHLSLQQSSQTDASHYECHD